MKAQEKDNLRPVVGNHLTSGSVLRICPGHERSNSVPERRKALHLLVRRLARLYGAGSFWP